MTAAIAEVPTEVKVRTPFVAAGAIFNGSVYEIPVDLIVRSETNRQPELDDDFVESIRHGVDSPVLVRPIKATQEHVEQWRRIDSPSVVVGQTIYKLVYGERRWAASKKAGNKTIPAIVRELTDTEALEIQVRENEQRKDYNALDRAAAYKYLRAHYMLDHKNERGFTEEKCCDLIAMVCKNDKIKGRTVQQIIALGKLTMDCQAALRKGEIEASHGYELCRRSSEDQAELLLWLRQQTHHSQGDIPSVRRLKLEIHNMDELREAEKRRQPLFTPPQPGTSTTRVPTVAEVALPGSKSIMKEYQQEKASAQTSAARPAKQIAEQLRKEEEKRKRSLETEKQARWTALEEIAKKVKLDRELVDQVLIEMVCYGDNAPAVFAAKAFGWSIGNPQHASYNQIEAAAKKHVPKMKPSQVAALLVACLVQNDLDPYYSNDRCEKLEAMARKYKVNIDKIRKDVAAAAKLKAKSQKPKAGVRA